MNDSDYIRELMKSTHRRLKFWGLWLYLQNKPPTDYPHENVLSKIMKRPKDYWLDRDGRVDWTEAEETDRAVQFVHLIQPVAGIALRCKYEVVDSPDDLPLRARQDYELKRFRRMLGREVSGSRFRHAVADGRRLVAGALMRFEDAA